MTNSENLVWFWAQRYAEKLGWANGKAIGKSGPRDSSEKSKWWRKEQSTAEKTERGVTINIGQEVLTYEKKKKRSVPERPRLVRMHIVWLYNADMLPPVSVCAEHFA